MCMELLENAIFNLVVLMIGATVGSSVTWVHKLRMIKHLICLLYTPCMNRVADNGFFELAESSPY